MRNIVTWVLIVMGLGLTAAGYALSAPWGADSIADSDPVVVGAPLIFIAGIISLLTAAILYELLPLSNDAGAS